MHMLRKGLRETVSQCLRENGTVIVMLLAEAASDLIFTKACGNGETADIIRDVALLRCHEIGQSKIGAVGTALHLLTQRMEYGERFLALIIHIKLDIIRADFIRRPETDYGTGLQPLLFHNLLEHLLRIGKE